MKEDRLGYPQTCPVCKRQNPSGFNLPEQCMWCKPQDEWVVKDGCVEITHETKPLTREER